MSREKEITLKQLKSKLALVKIQPDKLLELDTEFIELEQELSSNSKKPYLSSLSAINTVVRKYKKLVDLIVADKLKGISLRNIKLIMSTEGLRNLVVVFKPQDFNLKFFGGDYRAKLTPEYFFRLLEDKVSGKVFIFKHSETSVAKTQTANITKTQYYVLFSKD